MASALGKAGPIWIFLLVVAPEYYSENDDVIQITGKHTYEEAHEKCLSVGDNYSLPTFTKTANHIFLQKGVKEMWLAYRRHLFSNWTWDDGTDVDISFGSYPWRSGLTCGVLHLRDRVLEAENCYDGRVGFLCELQDKMDCLSNLNITHRRFECIKNGGRKFIYGCNSSVGSWYQARALCTENGLRMTKMDKEDLINILADHWILKGKKECRRFWIPLRREKWAYKTKGNYIYQVENDTFWGIGEPSSLGNCCTANIDQWAKFSWKAAECASRKPTVCIRYKDFKEEEYHLTSSEYDIPTVTTGSRKSAYITNGYTVLILTIVISSLLFLLCFVLMGVLIARTKRLFCNITRIPQKASRDKYEPLKRGFIEFNEQNNLYYLETIPSRILSSTRLRVEHLIMQDGLYKINWSDIALVVPPSHRNGYTKIDLTIHTNFVHTESLFDNDEQIISPAVTINLFSNSLCIGFPHNLPTLLNDKRQITVYKRMYIDPHKLHKVDHTLYGATSGHIWLNIESDNEQYYPCEYFCVVKDLFTFGLFLDAYIYSSTSKSPSRGNGSEVDIDVYLMEASFSVNIDFKRQMFQDQGKEPDLILNLQSSTATCQGATLCIILKSTEEWSVNGGNRNPGVTVVDLSNIHHSHHGLLAAQYTLRSKCKGQTRTLNNLSFHVENQGGHSEEILSRFLRIPVCL